ncbi:branched-chain amino acid transporter permease [Helicobacter sp. T3_23-1056]
MENLIESFLAFFGIVDVALSKDLFVVLDSLAILSVVFVATIASRFAPFVIFAKANVPKKLLSLGNALPPAMIGMLLVYCFKDIDFGISPFGANELAGIALVVLLYIVSRLGVLCVIGGTAGYMALVQSDVLSKIFG